jgi:hypothetical protein
MEQAWKRSEMQTRLWLESLKERHHLKVLGEDGSIIYLQ